MRLAIIGAAGNAGARIVSEALSRGHQVTAIGPTASKLQALEGVTAEIGDITQSEALVSIIGGHDVVISAVRFVRYKPSQLLESVRKSGVPRLAVVGGAGSLNAPAGGLVKDGPNFPEAALPEAIAGGKVLDALRAEQDIDWTFLSPSAIFAAGERTGNFRLGDDDLLIDAEAGKSHISFEDFAVALLDEIETPKHSRKRFTVGY